MWGSNRIGVFVEAIALRVGRFTRTIDRLITPERLRLYPRVFLAGSVLGVTLSSLGRIVDPSIQGPLMPDYLAHWTGGSLLLSGDSAHLYEPATQSAFQKEAIGTEVPLSWFVSPPIVAALYAPLSILPYSLSGLLWLVVSGALLVWCTLSLKTLAPRLMFRKHWVVILAVLGSPVVFELLGGGQDSAFILAVWLIGIRLLGSGHSFWAGTVLGLGFAKPQLVVLVPLVLLATRNYRAITGFVTVCALVLGISIGLVGLDGLYQWVSALSSPLYQEQVQHGQAWKMVGLPSFVQALLPQSWGTLIAPALTTAALPVGAAILLLRLYKVRKLGVDSKAIWIATLATTAAFSPHLATYDAILFIPVLVFLLERRPSPALRVSAVAAIGLLWIVPVLYLAAARLPWPLGVIDAPWSAIPLGYIWLESLRALTPRRRDVMTERPNPAAASEVQQQGNEGPAASVNARPGTGTRTDRPGSAGATT